MIHHKKWKLGEIVENVLGPYNLNIGISIEIGLGVMAW